MGKIEILQYGEGNFLRCFVEYKLQKAKNRGEFSGSVALVSPRSGELVPLFLRQKNRYTAIIRGIKNGGTVEEVLPVDVVADTVNPSVNTERYRSLYLSKELKIVVSNTTEAGIVCDFADTFEGMEGTFPAKAARMLFDRYSILGEDSGLDFLPCELIENNGAKLKECILWYARKWNLGDGFIHFIDKGNHFYNTLVDRIVTGFPKENPEEYYALAGWRDQLITVGEPYFLWVIEGEKTLAERHAWLDDPEVIISPSLRPYRERKVRVLNGLHTIGVPIALLSGIRTVGQAVRTPALRGFWEQCAKKEILPSLDLPQEEKEAYLAQIFDRFSNPYIEHAFRAIALNSVAKWKTRVLPSIRDYRNRFGKVPEGLTFSLAALLVLYQSDPATIMDAPQIRTFFERTGNLRDHIDDILSDVSWWGENLTDLCGFVPLVKKYVDMIEERGMAAALEAVWKAI